AELLGTFVMGVAQVLGDRQRAARFDVAARLADGEGAGVRLRRGGQVGYALGQVELAFRQADEFYGLRRGRGHDRSLRVAGADVFGRKNDESAGDEARVLAGCEHPSQPVDGGIRIAAAQTLDEGAGDVVMGIAGGIVVEGLALDRVLGDLEVKYNWRAGG